MKKLFISCPMKGRTEEQIRDSRNKMHKIAEAVFGEELEVIDSYIKKHPEAMKITSGANKVIYKEKDKAYKIGSDIPQIF